ncbi:MAG TPA: S9 family peptidase [Gemmatimonadales bacterium]
MRSQLTILTTLALALPLPAVGQAQAHLDLDRIFSSADFFGDRFGPARWLDGNSYTTVEGPRDAREIIRYDAASGARTVLVSAGQLTPAGGNGPLAIDDYDWSPDGRKLLVFTNSARVWRTNTRGDYWVLDLNDRSLRQLGRDAAPSTLMFAKFSPDGTRVGYVREHNVYVEHLASGQITALTHDGSATTINGTFDWVYEEELSLQDGFRWSPDGQRIAYWQLDATGVRDFLLINDTDSLYSYVKPVQYPKAGTTNSAARIGVVSSEGGPTTWMAVDGDPRNNYLARMDWAGPDQVVMQQLNRRQNELHLLLGDASSGAVSEVFTETDDAWVDVRDDFQWLRGGRAFTWVSERDGWRRAYVISRDGHDVRPVTPAAVDILQVTLVDEQGGWLYYMASPENATQRSLYRARLDVGGRAERLTPAAQPGTHGYQLSPNGRWALHSYSRFASPSVTALVSLPDHRLARALMENTALRRTVAELGLPAPEFLQVEVAPGVSLDGWMIKPSDFDSTKSYPVLFYVYGEPAGQTVVDRWGGRTLLWHHYLAEQGYLVMSVDNRGTPAPRGRDWRKVVYGEIGTLASQDQAAAVRAIAGARSYIDLTRVGIWGWSGGGSMTLNLMFRYPGIYRTGMAVAPVPDQRYYDTIYQERYMGLPQENAEGYRRGSPITYADRLEGNLLVVHGTGDDNVHYQGTEALINRLVEHNKPFTMMAYPNRTHGIFEGRGTTRHLYGLLTRYLLENLPAGGR